MKTKILSERNLVVILFVMVLVIFSLAQEYTNKVERIYLGTTAAVASKLLVNQLEAKTTTAPLNITLPAAQGE